MIVDRVLKKYGLTTDMRSHTTLRRPLIHLKDKIESEEKGELIYQILCKSCGAVYTGETGRLFQTRLNEHKKDIENAQKEQYTRNEKTRSQSTTNKSHSQSTTNKSTLTVHHQKVRPHSPPPKSPPSQTTTNKSALTDHTTTENYLIDREGVKVVDRKSHRRRLVEEVIWIRKTNAGINRSETRAITNFLTCTMTSSSVISTDEVAFIGR